MIYKLIELVNLFRQVNMMQFHKMLQYVLDRLNENNDVSVEIPIKNCKAFQIL